MTISEKANAVKLIKSQIKQAIIDKGVSVASNTPFSTYPEKIGEITGGSEPTLETLTVTPSTTAQTLTPPSGVDGFDEVSVNAVTAAIDSDIQAGNIRSGVEILGVTGNYSGESALLQSKTFTASSTTPTLSTVEPDSGYDGLEDVDVDLSYIENRLSSTNGGGSVPINYGPNREVDANGGYGMPLSNFTFSLPSNATNLRDYALFGCFPSCSYLTSVDLSNLTSITGAYAVNSAFSDCTNLISVDLSNIVTIGANNVFEFAFDSCFSLQSISFRSLTTVNGNNVFNRAFELCYNLASINFSNLSTLQGSNILQQAFSHCSSLSYLSFPSLNSNSFGSYTDQFNLMLYGVTGCAVHFPSNLEAVLGDWLDVTAGFGGTNTTVLFDLPATT